MPPVQTRAAVHTQADARSTQLRRESVINRYAFRGGNGGDGDDPLPGEPWPVPDEPPSPDGGPKAANSPKAV